MKHDFGLDSYIAPVGTYFIPRSQDFSKLSGSQPSFNCNALKHDLLAKNLDIYQFLICPDGCTEQHRLLRRHDHIFSTVF